jgi:hypothetical protein
MEHLTAFSAEMNQEIGLFGISFRTDMPEFFGIKRPSLSGATQTLTSNITVWEVYTQV